MSLDKPSPAVLFLSGDLIFASRVGGAARLAGWEFRLAGRVPEQPDPGIAMVLIDLSTRGGAAATVMQACEASCPRAKVLAYGPHVQVDRLRAAREAGIPTVLTRGQFDAALSGLFEPQSSHPL